MKRPAIPMNGALVAPAAFEAVAEAAVPVAVPA
jgi:hypothetical protein